MKIKYELYYKKQVTEKDIDIVPFKSNKNCVLIDVPIKGFYFNDTPILGCYSPAEKKRKWYPHVTIFVKTQGPKKMKKMLVLTFPYIYKEVYACSTSEDLIRVCLLKK